MVYLDMTNSSHQCPGDLEEVTLSGKRLCGRSASAAGMSCASAIFSADGLQYSQVCGKITGYQYGTTTAFWDVSSRIDSWYVSGITVTHGLPGSRGHVWTFANGWHETRDNFAACPCAPNAPSISIPSFIGQDYFCESAIVEQSYSNQLYADDPLWDGDGCIAENACCQFNDPPWFTKQLSKTTSDDLEVHTCNYYPRNSHLKNADTLAELIELYVK